MLSDQATIGEIESHLIDVNLAVSFLAWLAQDDRLRDSLREVAERHRVALSHVADALAARMPREGGAA